MDAPSEAEAEARRLGDEIATTLAHPAVAVSLADELDMLVPGRAAETIAAKARNMGNHVIRNAAYQCDTQEPACTEADVSNDNREPCSVPDLIKALAALFPKWPITKLPKNEGLLMLLYGTNAVETEKNTSHRAA